MKIDPSRGRQEARRLPAGVCGTPADDPGGRPGHNPSADACDWRAAVAAAEIVDGRTHRNNGVRDHNSGKYEK